MRIQIHRPIAERGVGIGAEVDGVSGTQDEAKPHERKGPGRNLHDVHGKHKEDGPAEQKPSPAQMRAAHLHTHFGPLESHQDAMQADAVKEHEHH